MITAETFINQKGINDAVAYLRRSERGAAVLTYLLALLDEAGGCSLDQGGKMATVYLLSAAFRSHPGSVLDALRSATHDP